MKLPTTTTLVALLGTTAMALPSSSTPHDNIIADDLEKRQEIKPIEFDPATPFIITLEIEDEAGTISEITKSTTRLPLVIQDTDITVTRAFISAVGKVVVRQDVAAPGSFGGTAGSITRVDPPRIVCQLNNFQEEQIKPDVVFEPGSLDLGVVSVVDLRKMTPGREGRFVKFVDCVPK